MAAMRARRGRGGGEPPKRGRRPAPTPDYGPMPRLARIKLSGGLSSDDVQVTPKSLSLAMAGVILFLGAGIAGAAWLGSSLFDAREAFARSADAAVANAGFEIEDIAVGEFPGGAALTNARVQEVRNLVALEGRHSILALDPDEVKARVEALDWVAAARVRRLWPSTLKVEVERRQEYAIWQDGERVTVIDEHGAPLNDERVEDHANLPRVVGAGAGPAARPLLVALEGLPHVRAHLVQLVRKGDRRWDVELTSGGTVALPEHGAPEALAQLERLHDRYALLDRPVDELDMRAPGRLAVRIYPELEGGPDLRGGV